MIGATSSNTSNDAAVIDEFYVKVMDYDGTIIDKQYMHNREICTLPQAPIHNGLIFQEWSGSENIINGQIIINNNNIKIGAIYTTISGQNEFDIELNENTGLSVTLNMNGTKDWGDGTSDTSTSHTYSNYGKYTIKCDGTTITSSSSSGLFGQSSSNTNTYVKNVRLANISSVTEYSFQYCNFLENVLFSNELTNIGTYAFRNCISLINLTLPNSLTTIATKAFNECYALINVVLPYGITTISGVFYKCYALKDIIISSSITNLEGAFDSCYTLTDLIIPNNVVNIGGSAFSSCFSLTKMKIPSSVINVGGNAFSSCYAINEYDFKQSLLVPTLNNTNAFGSINKLCKIKVPWNLYLDWIAATNWSTYINYIDGGTPATINFNVSSTASPNIYVDNNIINNTSIKWIGSSIYYYCYDDVNYILYPPTLQTNINEGSTVDININMLSYNKITLDIGISDLEVIFRVDNIFFNVQEDTLQLGTYSLNVIGSGTVISYTVIDDDNYMREKGTIITTGSDITKTITMRPATTEAWVRPNLTANGILGGESFAVSAESNSASYPAWKAVDSDTSTSSYWYSKPNDNIYIFYNPDELKVTKLEYKYYYSGLRADGVSIQGSNDNINWEDITSSYTIINSSTYKSTLNNDKYYNYYKLTFTPYSSGNYLYLCDLAITALIKVPI